VGHHPSRTSYWASTCIGSSRGVTKPDGQDVALRLIRGGVESALRGGGSTGSDVVVGLLSLERTRAEERGQCPAIGDSTFGITRGGHIHGEGHLISGYGVVDEDVACVSELPAV
jgi:hypothetical protein